jgi:hypothetical protein
MPAEWLVELITSGLPTLRFPTTLPVTAVVSREMIPKATSLGLLNYPLFCTES